MVENQELADGTARVNKARVTGVCLSVQVLLTFICLTFLCRLWFLLCKCKSLPRDSLCFVLISGNSLPFRKRPIDRNLLKSNF